MSEFFRSVVPGLIYLNVFLLLGHFTAGGSGITTIFLIASGAGVELIVDYLALREITGQADGQMLKQVSIAILIQCIIAGMLLNFFIPNIANFNFMPIA